MGAGARGVMRTAAPDHRDLVLVGGGHSHALALRMLAMKPIDGLRITLISPASHTPYSGMLPGLIAGHYTFEDAHIDLERLCRWAGVRFIVAEVTALNPAARTVAIAGRPPLAYDLLSIDIGSQPELDAVPGAREHAVPVKPVAGLWQRWRALEAGMAERAGAGDYRVSVVGGGAGGIEIAMAMSHRLAGRAAIDLWCAAPRILEGYNARARGAVEKALAAHNVTLHTAARVVGVEPGELAIEGGARARYDDLFWCTGAGAAPWLAASGLPVDARGFLAVRDTLQSTGDERVFGAGDCAAQLNHPRPKAGVFAVRQGPVLARNLRAAALGNPLREHRPQRRFLSLVSLGDRRAVADRGLFSASGAWVWRWKDRIDREFMTRFSDLPRSMPARAWGRLPELAGVGEQEACGGCGAKVGADILNAALAELAGRYPEHCVNSGDDAVAVSAGGALLQSVDVLRELVADPWHMGRIAANHALSDLYACGARPTSALAVVTLPFAASRIQLRDLTQLLGGALDVFRHVDCRLVGGHTMQGPELAVGFAVNGVAIAGDGAPLDKRGARVGDLLVLTRPLGTGVLFAAHMQLAVDGRHVHGALAQMHAGNGAAAELAVALGASACTDVTGFGLAGHLREMLGATLAARVDLAALPVLPGALAALSAGYRSTMHAANEQGAAGSERVQGAVDDTLRDLLYDPQTSGGLLIAIAPEHAGALLEALADADLTEAAVIGAVIEREPGPGNTLVLSQL